MKHTLAMSVYDEDVLAVFDSQFKFVRFVLDTDKLCTTPKKHSGLLSNPSSRELSDNKPHPPQQCLLSTLHPLQQAHKQSQPPKAPNLETLVMHRSHWSKPVVLVCTKTNAKAVGRHFMFAQSVVLGFTICVRRLSATVTT